MTSCSLSAFDDSSRFRAPQEPTPPRGEQEVADDFPRRFNYTNFVDVIKPPVANTELGAFGAGLAAGGRALLLSADTSRARVYRSSYLRF